MKVYPLGYARSGYKVEQMMARDPDLLIIDTRYSPNGNPEWTGAVLKARYGRRYRWAGKFLGNVNYKGGPIHLANPCMGISGLVQYLREGHDLILLCKCQEYESCHRKLIVDLLQASCPEVEVVQPEDVPADPVIYIHIRGRKPSKPCTRMTDPGSKVFVAIKGENVPAIVLESWSSPNGDYRDCKLKIAAYNALSRQWLISVYPRPVQSYKLSKRYKDIPELDDVELRKLSPGAE